MNETVDANYDVKRRRIERNVGGLYSVEQTLGLVSAKPMANEPVMHFKALAKHEAGSLAFKNTENDCFFVKDADIFSVDQTMFKPVDLSISEEDVCRGGTIEHMGLKSFGGEGVLPALVEDQNVIDILEKHEVDMVVTSSVLTCLVDNQPPGYEKEWEIPVTVQERDHPCEEGKKMRHVFLDKPLLTKHVTCRQKSEMYYDKLLKRKFLSRPELAGVNGEKSDPERNDTSSSMNTESDEDEGESLVLDIDEEVVNSHSSETRADSSCDQRSVSYSIWGFGNLNILVRSRIHGIGEEVVTDSATKKTSIIRRTLGIKSKLHYQYSSLGCLEQTSASESARWWMHCFLRPESHMLIGHIDPMSSKLLYLETKTMKEILSPLSQFKPGPSMKRMRLMLELSSSLAKGKYILSHKAGTPHVVLFKEAFSKDEVENYQKGETNMDVTKSMKGCYDLKAALSNRGQNSEADSFVDLACTKKMTGRIPFLFPPSSKPAMRASKGSKKQKQKRKKEKECRQFIKDGFCRRGDGCKYSHNQSMSGNSGGSKQKKRKRKTTSNKSSDPSRETAPIVDTPTENVTDAETSCRRSTRLAARAGCNSSPAEMEKDSFDFEKELADAKAKISV